MRNVSEHDAPDLPAGVVTGFLPNQVYAVRLAEGRVGLAHLAQPLRLATVRIQEGDRVRVRLSPYDNLRGTIAWHARP